MKPDSLLEVELDLDFSGEFPFSEPDPTRDWAASVGPDLLVFTRKEE